MASGDITTVFFENRATSMSYVSALTLVVYDIIVSFGQEARRTCVEVPVVIPQDAVFLGKILRGRLLEYINLRFSITAWVNISEEPIITSFTDDIVFQLFVPLNFFPRIHMAYLTSRCHLYYYWLFLAGPSTYLFILDLILLLRVYALYNQNKFLFIFLSSCAVGSVATALWAFSVVCRRVSLIRDNNGCSLERV
ncbi:hypothetical protein EV421DRAFT_1906953 [Armillaria borealis]|uniref:Uncharacterized protein n=1 Tax=Armillaria borealis TaxID=47425 RepID=A0AA39JB48_9AGAR|nr:hypothetical protein EV421DRAFT_1906953 [Armillaria borealis]